MNQRTHIPDPIPAIDRALAGAVRLYDRAATCDDEELRAQALMLLTHIRQARKVIE